MRDIQTESDCRIGVCPTDAANGQMAKWRDGEMEGWSIGVMRKSISHGGWEAWLSRSGLRRYQLTRTSIESLALIRALLPSVINSSFPFCEYWLATTRLLTLTCTLLVATASGSASASV